MSFTDGQPRIATEEDCAAKWSGGRNGIFFRCKVCGHRFVVGDVWRFVYMTSGDGVIGGMGIPNALVCGACDGPDVRARIVEHWREAVTRFWHLFDESDLRRAESAPKAAPSGAQEG